ncbi:CHAT domain-containing protein [Thermopolyspora sp. NPDC052614]|uniref:CHAT domain-containing protein n=1 Tax=Thermopolyspora sp. NPDC052614 TaxID=3155682 RepID=UPI003430AC7B
MTGDLPDMVFSRPKVAVSAARALLGRSPSPYDASIAHQVLGIFQRDFGDLEEAFRELGLALRYARRSRSCDREADVLATLGVAHVMAGRTGRGLRRLDEAVTKSGAKVGTKPGTKPPGTKPGTKPGAASAAKPGSRPGGRTAGRVLFRRGGALHILGRHGEALADLRSAVPLLRAADDVIYTARALTLRALIHLALGGTEAADADLRAAEALWATTDQQHDIAVAVHNRGIAAFRLGDLPAALGHLEDAAERFAALGTPAPDLSADRCAVLLAAGLARDALAEADEAIARLGGQATRRAELLLIAARAALAAHDPGTAIARAGQAARLFARQRRDWWRAHARLVLLQARFAAGDASGRLVGEAAAVAERLAALGSPESVRAHLLAGRTALALGRAARADLHLAQAARARLRGPVMSRAEGWLAEALRAHAAGNTRRVLHACRRGLDLLDEHRLTLGASELRALAAAQGAELAALAQRTCLASGRSRDLLAWSERWRATALAVPSVSPPDDRELRGELTAFREVTGRLESGRDGGAPPAALLREQRRLERAIRARTLRVPGSRGSDPRRLDPGELLAALGSHTTLVEIVSIAGRLHVLVCASGRVQRWEAGTLAEAVGEVEYARSLLRRLAYGRPPGHRIDVLEATATRLQEVLLGPAARHLGDGPVVVVPPGRLHGVPWALLPALRDAAVSVCPSAGAWLAARSAVPPPHRDVVLVGGPGLRSRAAELPALAARYAAPHSGDRSEAVPGDGRRPGFDHPVGAGGSGPSSASGRVPDVDPRFGDRSEAVADDGRRPGFDHRSVAGGSGPSSASGRVPDVDPRFGDRSEAVAGDGRRPGFDRPVGAGGSGPSPVPGCVPDVDPRFGDRSEAVADDGRRPGFDHSVVAGGSGPSSVPGRVPDADPRPGAEPEAGDDPRRAFGHGTAGRANFGLSSGGVPEARARVLTGGAAKTGAVLEAIDGAWLAHIAAHGEFRADSPLFSSLRMDDGPLTVHDFERLRRAPYRLILPSCDSGRLASVGADELLGLAAALFPLGTAGLAACLVPVNDEAVVPLMLVLHERLGEGATLAEAMRDARRSASDDPLHLATGWSFTVMGAV